MRWVWPHSRPWICRSCGGPVEPDDGTLVYHFGWCTPEEAAARRDDENHMREIEHHRERLVDLGYDTTEYDTLVRTGSHPIQARITVIEDAIESRRQWLIEAGYDVAAYLHLVETGVHPVHAVAAVVDEADAMLHADLLAAEADAATAAAIVIGDVEEAPLAGGDPSGSGRSGRPTGGLGRPICG